MKNYWITSDLHLNHENILNFTDAEGNRIRLFDTVKQMNECLLDSHNSVVKPGDYVYNLGDVFFGDKEEFKKLWSKFNGSKRLIPGNHDDVRFLVSGGFFKKVYSTWRIFKEHRIILSHIPLHENSLWRGSLEHGQAMFNVHGHIHKHKSPPGPYHNVCVENTNYTPVNLDELISVAKTYFEE